MSSLIQPQLILHVFPYTCNQSFYERPYANWDIHKSLNCTFYMFRLRLRLSSVIELLALIKKHKPCIIHSHSASLTAAFVLILAYLSGHKQSLIYTSHGSDVNYSYDKSLFYNLVKYLCNLFVLPFYDVGISVSARLFASQPRCKKSLRFVIPEPTMNDHQGGEKAGLNYVRKFNIAYATRSYVKNYRFSRRLVRHLRSSNPDISAIELDGSQTHKKVVQYLSNVHILVAPSLSEGSSLLVREALELGCYVISSCVGDAESLLLAYPGQFFIKPTIISEYARLALILLSKNPILVCDSQAILQRRFYDIDTYRDKHQSIYSLLIDEMKT